MPAFALTIFLGAFLLFQIQPLIGKYILPWFGGGPGVWTTCLLFFQVVLLGGYTYAHLSSRWLGVKRQVLVHVVLLIAALAMLPIIPADAWKPSGGGNPTLQILALLAASIGVPYFVLSSTGPLLQRWFSRVYPGRSPYRLFALSNSASLLALLTYPFFFEPHFTRRTQAGLWGWGLVAYGLCCGYCALKFWRAVGDGSQELGVRNQEPGIRSQNVGLESKEPLTPTLSPSDGERENSPLAARPSPLTQLLWLLLPACASVLLLAVTNKMCQDVAVIPFLWVLPLALYLLSFIICFDNPRWYARVPFTLALIAALGGICWALFKGTDAPMWKQVAIYLGGLFFCCMTCHGELYRLRPDPSYLTGFYLMIAAGGALGGAFVAVIAPLVFTNYYELHWGMFLCALLFLVVCATENTKAHTKVSWGWLACALALAGLGGLDRFLAWLAAHPKALPKGCFTGLRIGLWAFLLVMAVSWVLRGRFRTFRYWRGLACLWILLGVAALGTTLWVQTRDSGSEKVLKSRNFYGVLTVFEHRRDDPSGHHLLLQHGRITHGLQFLDPRQATWPTTYYGEASGVGLAWNALPAGGRRVGVVGLGAGTLTAYGRAGDYVRVYEINPEVRRLATTRFTYLSNCSAEVEVAIGDARLSMEREAPQQFDLLALDAFSSDAIPVHLLTREAFVLYERHLKTNGVIAVHISNHFLDLEPVVSNLAREFNYRLVSIDYDDDEEEWWLYSCTWILLSRSQQLLDSPTIHQAASGPATNSVKIPLWTDDFASLFQILR